ncbi:class I adenylate-forming enzyme family protein [Pseudaestuariivita rosea]|uniref:class I adenylate-forming enzyme family protein n=1 Tax=Pseudaestuariivita rosea TaxID=2763263 RepID=UPI001ABBB8A1|nr:class I adenylate-forming enzyme family protein [Pseudaestuariivita rosea]
MHAIFDQGPPPPCPGPFNLAAYVLARADDTPDKIALAIIGPTGSERWSYARLQAAVLGTATGLLQTGIKPGDRILMRLGNTVDFPVCYLAAIAIGAVAVPTSAQLTAPEITRITNSVNPALIVAAPGIALPDHDAPVLTQDQLRGFRDLPAAPYDMGDPDRPGYIIFTSGTTEQPRGVVHAHRAIWARRMMFDHWYHLRNTDRLMHAGAFNWTYTLGTGLLDPWTIGATALIPADGVKTMALPLLIQRHDVTIFAATPGIYRQILRSDKHLHFPKLRHGLSAGEKLPQATRTAWTDATGTPIAEAFGMSECSTFISSTPDDPTHLRPQMGRRIAILEDGQPVANDQPGHIAIARSDPGLMLNYLDDTAGPGDWFVTTDQATMALEGTVTYLGRSDDMMNAGGFRVSPLEVEAALQSFPGLHDCAATEVMVKADTTVIALFYTADTDLPQAQLSAYAEERLARYKQPRLYIRTETLPRNANNKLQRHKLRQRYEDTHGQT